MDTMYSLRQMKLRKCICPDSEVKEHSKAVPNAFDERSIPNLPGVERGDIDLNKTEPKTA